MEYIVKEFKTDKCTIVARKPILTAEERRKREAEVRKALVEFGREMLRSGKNVI